MVRNALKRGCIHPSAYGSVPGRTAHGAVLHKLLAIEQTKNLKHNGALFECDAKGCYDRIIPAFTAVHTRRLGLEKQVTATIVGSLQDSDRHIGTKTGISDNSIRSTKTEPLFGIGQGSGAGPALWLAHLVVMMKAFDSVCNGITVQSPDGEIKHKSGCTGYVDDCNVITKSTGGNCTIEEVQDMITSDAQWWEKLLYTNGGKLELTKCFWYMVYWKWKAGSASLTKMKEKRTAMRLIQSETREQIVINQKDIDDPVKVLGINVPINGKWEKEFRRWNALSRQYAGVVRRAQLNRQCGNMVYHSLWLPKVKYIAGIVNFKKKQWNNIQSPILNECLACSGYNRRMPRAVVFGPAQYGGMGWEEINTTAMYEATNLALKHLKRDDDVGKLIKINIETTQLLAGVGTPVLELNTCIKYLEDSWIMTLHNHLINTGMHLVTQDTWVPNIQRVNDNIIMDMVQGYFSPNELRFINQCRLYLQALSIADITTLDGRSITEEAWNVRRTKSFKESRLHWPEQRRPSRQAIVTWRKALAHTGHRNRRLSEPLGKWLRTPYKKWKYEASRRGIIKHVNNITTTHLRKMVRKLCSHDTGYHGTAMMRQQSRWTV